AVSHFGVGIRDVLGMQSAVDRLPRLAAVVAAEGARGRDGDVHPFRIGGIEQDGVEAHAARARLPLGPRAVAAQPGELLPRLAPVAGALDDLPEPPARLRRVQPIRIDRRALEVVDLPAREVRATDIPPFALAVRRQDERALARTDQHSYSAHGSLLPRVPRL